MGGPAQREVLAQRGREGRGGGVHDNDDDNDNTYVSDKAIPAFLPYSD